jgi:hypothetical protein
MEKRNRLFYQFIALNCLTDFLFLWLKTKTPAAIAIGVSF